MSFKNVDVNLREKAEDQVAQYPQYKGYFDDWIPVLITKETKTKLGIAFESCEFTLAKPEVRHILGSNNKIKMFMTAWSYSNRCATSVPFEHVRTNHPVTLTHVKVYM
jgi:hypothetical protein